MVCVCSCRFSPLSGGSLSIIPGVKLSERGWKTDVSRSRRTAMGWIQQFMEDVFLDKLLPTGSGWKAFAIVKPHACSNDQFCPGAANLEEKVRSYLEGICWLARRWHSPSNKSTTYLNIYWQSWKGVCARACVCMYDRGGGGSWKPGMAVSCQNRFKAPAAELVYRLMHYEKDWLKHNQSHRTNRTYLMYVTIGWERGSRWANLG